MSGGIAYLFNEENIFDEKKFNLEMVELESLCENDFNEILYLLKNHYKYTNSSKAKYIMDNWPVCKKNFIKVMPTDYKRALEMIASKKIENQYK